MRNQMNSSRPLFRLADLSGFAYAYPLYGMARRFPDGTTWALNTFAAPFYRRLHRSQQAEVARRMSRRLEIPHAEAEALAARWTSYRIRAACDDLAALSGKDPAIHADFAGLEHLDRAIGEGRGVLLACIHSFAAIPAKRVLRRMGYPMLSVRPRRFTNPKLGRLGRRWLLPRLQRLHAQALEDAEPVFVRDVGCALRIAQRLRQGGIAEMAADAGFSAATVAVPFLNGQRPIGRGVLELARMCRCPVLPLSAIYLGDGLRVEIGEPLPSLELPVLVNELERQVRAYPDQWSLWLGRSVA
jgi:lauroyl/myristoyl acyltransferase